MGERTNFEDFVDHIMSDDDSELGKTKAELNYALHCLEREIAICARTQAHNDAMLKALKRIAEQQTSDELAEHGEDSVGDYEAGYDAIIKIAREALAASTPDLHGEGGER